jgi:alpha-N-arabinofuranosidase
MSSPIRSVLHPAFVVDRVDERLFGGFLEHLGRAVYGGVYEPGHPSADARGFRKDVVEHVRELGMPVMRYPGGNFVSAYDWEKGTGPAAERKAELDLAWEALEPNTFGTNEFVEWCREVNTAPMLAVNLGTRGIDAARELVEYCNHPGGTRVSDRRREHGFTEPHAVKLWCLGNEMDGWWQLGAKTAREYGRLACEAAKAMRMTDKSIELVACGSSNSTMPSFGSWELEVLEHTIAQVDYLSLHMYFSGKDKDPETYWQEADRMDEYIEKTAALCDSAAAVKKSNKRIQLCFDEWNSWYHSHGTEKNSPKWTVGRSLLEETYDVSDAIMVGAALITLLNHVDRVKIACLAQVVNVIAPIMTKGGGPSFRHTIFHPFALTSRFGRGTVLRHSAREVGPVRTAAVVSDGGDLNLFAVNRSTAQAAELDLDIGALGDLRIVEHVGFAGGLERSNSFEAPNAVTPTRIDGARLRDSRLHVELPAASWSMVRLSRAFTPSD